MDGSVAPAAPREDSESSNAGARASGGGAPLATDPDVERILHLPAAIRDSRVLRTLILLDLESHPPEAAIDIVEIDLAVTPGRIVQGALLTRSLPSE